MRKNPFKLHMKLLLLCLPILIICAVVQYVSFYGLMQQEIKGRYDTYSYSANDYEEAKRIAADINKRYGEKIVLIDITRYESSSGLWNVEWVTDRWVDYPPKLTDLLSRTINTPLIISTLILVSFLIILLIERDYKPNKSVLTLLRLPRPRSRYLLSKLVSPTALMFLFWGIQYLVVILQTGNYLNAVPEALRPSNSSPWTFDYYRILYPVTEPIWFPATACALCMIPLIIVTIIFVAKGGIKGWGYGVLPFVGAIAIVAIANRVSNMWWLMPVLLVAVYLNCRLLLNKGQIVQ